MFQAAYSTGSLFIFDEFYCTSGCFQDLFIVSLCFHPTEWWSYLLLWTGLCTAVASADADICLGRFNRRHPCGSYCTLQRDCDVLSGDTVLIKTLKFLVLSLNWKATLFLSILLFFFSFCFADILGGNVLPFPPPLASPLFPKREAGFDVGQLSSLSLHICTGFHLSIRAPLSFSLFKNWVKLVHHNTLTQWI